MSSSFFENKYKLVDKLGQGKFGTVYKGEIRTDPAQKKTPVHVAIKFDYTDTGALKHEATILNYLHHRRKPHGNMRIPEIHWYGLTRNYLLEDATEYPCMVIPYYEWTLTDFVKSNSTNDNYTTMSVWLMQRMLDILETIHDVYVIHRDLKPDNFMLKNGDIFLIDFGLSTFYIDGETEEHVPVNTEPKTEIVGSPVYVSTNVHAGIRNARRDDGIQLGYIFFFMLLYGHLPWEGLEHIETETPQMSPGNIEHPMNQERCRQKRALIYDQTEFLDIMDHIGEMELNLILNYLQTCYELPYDARPPYVLDLHA